MKQIILLFFLLPLMISAQEDNTQKKSRHSFGFIYGQGSQDLGGFISFLGPNSSMNLTDKLMGMGVDPEKVGIGVPYMYDVQFFQFQYYFLLAEKNWDIEIIVQPQYNITRFKPFDEKPEILEGYEYGLNAGILFRKELKNDRYMFYTYIGSGPHFVSDAPFRQTEGFLFSDNLFIGLNIRLYQNLYLDLRPGIRHASNANIVRPNGGLNTIVFSGGLYLRGL